MRDDKDSVEHQIFEAVLKLKPEAVFAPAVLDKMAWLRFYKKILTPIPGFRA